MKTSTAIIVGIGLLVAGGLAFLFIRRNGQGLPVIAGPTTIGSSVNPQVITQPSQLYPVTGPQPVRQDTASEPWSATSLPPNSASLAVSGLQSTAMDLKAVSSVVSSVKSIWDDLDISSWWSGSSEATQTQDWFAPSTTNSSGFSWNNYLGVW